MSGPLSVSQVARRWDKPTRTIREWCEKGGVFPGAFQIGNRWAIPEGDVIRREGNPHPVGEPEPPRHEADLSALTLRATRARTHAVAARRLAEELEAEARTAEIELKATTAPRPRV